MTPALVDLKLHDGGSLAIPPHAISFIEDLTSEQKRQAPGATTGIFYDVGAGQESAWLSIPFPRVLKIAERAERPGGWLQFQRRTAERQDRCAIPGMSLAALRSVKDDEAGANCIVSHRMGSEVYMLRVAETFDEIRAMTQPDGAPVQAADDQEVDGENGGHGTENRDAGTGGSDQDRA